MESKKTTLISLRIDPAIARAFKIEAAEHDLKLKELFEEMFKVYKAAKKRGRNDG